MAKKHQRSAENGCREQRFRGVRMRKWGKWVAEVRVPKSRERIWLGSYSTPHQAARAYDAAVFCLRGSHARLNFPHSAPHIPAAASLSPPQIQAVAAAFALQDIPDKFPGSECESCVKSKSNWEGNKCETLVDLEKSESPNLDGFPLTLADLEFLLLGVEALAEPLLP